MDNSEIQQRKARAAALKSENEKLRKQIAELTAVRDKASERRTQLETLRSDLETIADRVRGCSENSSLLKKLAADVQSLTRGGAASQSEQNLISMKGSAEKEVELAEYQIGRNKSLIDRLEEEIRQLQVAANEGNP